ncbi:hydrophobic surface binding protein [Zymoseptoria brevis]|uniref:Hydrophobic surface binding protein n=1 Tax=Zymoseptoria brevis TaxID=1047168 RepID=A0A0F4G8A8_9PEZI|nr:hydrophobic surface binding protein [Zymoseptoria brevis]
MLRLSKFAQLAASAKNAMSSRDAQKPLENLTTINASVQKLIQVVNAYEGGLLAASPISSQEAALGVEIKNAVADANAMEVQSVEDSKAVIAFINETLEPSIQACMGAMQAKKELFIKSSLVGTVTGDMQDLRSQTGTLGKALLAKSPKEEHAEGEAALKKVDANFEEALRYFG